jgi:serpin B
MLPRRAMNARHLALLLLACIAACSGTSKAPPPRERVAAASSRCEGPGDPGDPSVDRAELVAGNTAFALDLYRSIAVRPGTAPANLFFSPYSISLALAMTYAGAGGTTATQLARALHFTLPPERLHAAFGALDAELESRGSDASDGGQPFHLRVASSLGVQRSLAIGSSFLTTLRDDYRSSLQQADFEGAPDAARVAIDRWVSDRTQGAIPELFGPGTIGRDARLVLADAIDFDAGWAFPFDPQDTAAGPFHGEQGEVTSVPLMHAQANLLYAEGDGWQAVALPYDGLGVSMLVVLPDAGEIDAFQAGLDADRLARITGGLGIARITLTLPRFSVHPGSTSLKDRLMVLGVTDAFDPARADFSAIARTTPPLSVGDVVHQAFIDVDENGTHAAAATGVTIVGLSAPLHHAVVTVDRPFVYALRDAATGTILFLGRVTSL